MKNKNMRSTGVILARLQPVHNGHLALIEKSLRENDDTYVFVGSADKFNERNPIPIGLRIQLLKEAIEERFGAGVDDFFLYWFPDNKCFYGDGTATGKTLHIVPLDDLSDESHNDHEWGFYLYSKIVTESNSPNFTMYYSDGFEIITTWFPSFILRNNISLNLIARNSCEKGISATAVREAILKNDEEALKKYVPSAVFEKRQTLADHINLSKMCSR